MEAEANEYHPLILKPKISSTIYLDMTEDVWMYNTTVQTSAAKRYLFRERKAIRTGAMSANCLSMRSQIFSL